MNETSRSRCVVENTSQPSKSFAATYVVRTGKAPEPLFLASKQWWPVVQVFPSHRPLLCVLKTAKLLLDTIRGQDLQLERKHRLKPMKRESGPGIIIPTLNERVQ